MELYNLMCWAFSVQHNVFDVQQCCVLFLACPSLLLSIIPLYGYFTSLAIINNVSVNIQVQVFVWIYFHFLKILRSFAVSYISLRLLINNKTSP